MRGVADHIPEGLIERFKLLNIRVCVRLVGCGVDGVNGDELRRHCLYDGDGVDGCGPDVLVPLVRIRACRFRRGCILRLRLHSLDEFFFVERDIVHHFEGMYALVQAGEYAVHPCVIFSADIGKQVRVLDSYDILTRRVKGVHLFAELEQHRYLRVGARRDLPRKIECGKYCGYDGNAAARRGSTRGGAGGKQSKKGQQR
ncbi:hypothetical protein SDC9_119354 [bioreactor metagenome]|uniref:Uncharacterized protein n=1 Tax=bioreactor metagenome TaxID=1076179 RepID=A0A645C3N1_9ZZZZ